MRAKPLYITLETSAGEIRRYPLGESSTARDDAQALAQREGHALVVLVHSNGARANLYRFLRRDGGDVILRKW